MEGRPLTILLVAEIDKVFVRRRRARSMEPKGGRPG
jgi:hypothetical protein